MSTIKKKSNQRTNARRVTKQSPKPYSPLADAVDDLRQIAHVHQIEDSFDAIVAYAVNSDLFQKEQDNVSRINYMTLMYRIRRIWTLALAEIPEPEAVLSPDLM